MPIDSSIRDDAPHSVECKYLGTTNTDINICYFDTVGRVFVNVPILT